MILIADSGSTKTEWSLANEGKLLMQFTTAGFNPYYYSQEAISQMLQRDFPVSLVQSEVNEIFYYGSGCSTPTNCGIVSNAFSQLFSQAKITINHDLLGAAHALLGHQKGIACILGTGSNSCAYDGQNITHKVPSLGYLLGDEGSGVHIGKSLLQAYFYNEMPETLASEFEKQYPMNLGEVLDTLYRKDRPGSFLAAFAPFARQHIHNAFINNLIGDVFDAFIKVQLSKYPDYQSQFIGFAGSIAYQFSEILIERLSYHGMLAGNIMASPSDGLLDYYKISK